MFTPGSIITATATTNTCARNRALKVAASKQAYKSTQIIDDPIVPFDVFTEGLSSFYGIAVLFFLLWRVLIALLFHTVRLDYVHHFTQR